MVLAHHTRGEHSTNAARPEHALDSLRELTQRLQRGLSFAELQRAAAAYSLSSQGWIVPAGQLRTIPMPAIVHFPNHYVVLDSIRRGSAYLRDPAIGRVRMTLAMLARRSTGRVLVFSVNSTHPAAPPTTATAIATQQQRQGPATELGGLR
jgi:ABC-type bacteriocin/lantibiotic exporter with double-glycine peptidase domain